MTTKTKPPRLTLQSLKVLRVLYDNPAEPYYGYDIIDRTGIKAGTLYPILARLEAAGWIKSRWEKIDPKKEKRPKRKLFKLTSKGIMGASEAFQALTQELTA